MKIYTGVGDRGKTSLFSGERVAKCHVRIEAYGDVDELSCVLGALVAQLGEATADLAAELRAVQSTLLHVGAYLATTPGSPAMAHLTPVGRPEISRLEASIDRQQAALPPLSAFVLPGGSPDAAWAHLARVVCRRAERKVVALGQATGVLAVDSREHATQETGPAAGGERCPAAGGERCPPSADREGRSDAPALLDLLVYLNRLSDYLFVVARTCNARAGLGDQLWEKT
jgi:cob(I)alamin adenosyltransferase